MTLEEALILLLAAAALISLFLGLAQALEGRPPRPTARHPPRSAPRRSASTEPIGSIDPPPAEAAQRRPADAVAEPIAPAVVAAPAEAPSDAPSTVSEDAPIAAPLPEPRAGDAPRSPERAVPEEDDAATLRGGVAGEASAETHAEAATALVHDGDFAGACRYVEHAAESGELSAEQAQALLELVAGALRREVDRLTAAAIRGSKDEAPAVTGLAQAETLLGSIPDGPVALPHRSAMARRIWRAYTKLGFRRLGAGEIDGAADVLFHALAMKGVGRQRQVRDALVRALEAMGDQRVTAVAALLGQGDRAGAAGVVADLEACIQRARAEGVPAEELEVAAAKLQQLATRLEDQTAPR